jgi:hypothetical protein
MSLAAPRRPWRWAVVAAATWLVLVVVAATVEGDSIVADVAREVLSTAAAAALAVAAGGGLLGWWQQREWRNRTQWVTVDLVDRTMRRLAGVAAAAFDVADAAVPGTASITPLSQVFRLRWSDVREDAVHQESEALRATLMAWAATDAPATATTASVGPSAVTHGLRRSRTTILQERADALWDTLQELTAYLDDHHGPRLLTVAGELHAAVRDVADPIPGDNDDGSLDAQLWMLVAVQLGRVVDGAGAVAGALDSAYATVRGRLGDADLIARVSADDRIAAGQDGGLRTLLASHSEAAAGLAAFDTGTTDTLTAAQEIVTSAREILDDPASTDQERADAQDAIAEVTDVLTGLEKNLRSAFEPPPEPGPPPPT